VREHVFVQSLKYHGFRKAQKHNHLKWARGYIIHATTQEDSSGIDFWVKMPRDSSLIPIQITQRGVRLFKHFQSPSSGTLSEFLRRSQKRIRQKQIRCALDNIAFVLVRDYHASRSNTNIAWGDVKALRYGVSQLRQRT
jgi:hypothetical protein